MIAPPEGSDGGQEPNAPAPPPRARSSRLSSVIWGAVVVLLLAGVAWFVHSRAPRDPRAGRGNTASVSVVTAPVQQGDLPVTLNALGTVTPLATVTVKTQINGQLVAIGFQEGQIVNVGDFLAQVDPRAEQRDHRGPDPRPAHGRRRAADPGPRRRMDRGRAAVAEGGVGALKIP
jgi:multidrug resistance efflux pump